MSLYAEYVNRKNAGDTDQQIIDHMNAKTRMLRDTNRKNLEQAGLALIQAGQDPNDVIGAFRHHDETSLSMLSQLEADGLDFANAIVVGKMAEMEQSVTTQLTQTQIDVLVALNQRQISLWEETNGEGEVYTLSDLQMHENRRLWDNSNIDTVLIDLKNNHIDVLMDDGTFSKAPPTATELASAYRALADDLELNHANSI